MALFFTLTKCNKLVFTLQITKNGRYYSILSRHRDKTKTQSCCVATSKSNSKNTECQNPKKAGGVLARNLQRIKSFSFLPKSQQTRQCFHPGASVLSREDLSVTEKAPITSKQMISAMLQYIWPADDPAIRKRVSVAVGLLVGAKLLNVAVPFMFKYSVDYLNAGGTLNMTTAPETVATVVTSLLIGCKYNKHSCNLIIIFINI